MSGDAQSRPGRGKNHPVQGVGPGEGQGGGQPVEAQPALLVHRLVLDPDA